MLSLAMYGWVFNLGLLVFLAVCFILILAVMIQKPQGGGLSAAFGASSGSGQTAFGTKTGDALTVATILVFVFWLVVAVGLNLMTKPERPAAAARTPASTPATPPANGPAGGAPQDSATTPPANTPPANTPDNKPEAPGAVTPPAGNPPANTPAVTPPANVPAPAPGEPKPAEPK